MDPRGEGTVAIKVTQLLPGLDEGILSHVFCSLTVSQQAEAYGKNMATMLIVQYAKSRRISGTGLLNQS